MKRSHGAEIAVSSGSAPSENSLLMLLQGWNPRARPFQTPFKAILVKSLKPFRSLLREKSLSALSLNLLGITERAAGSPPREDFAPAPQHPASQSRATLAVQLLGSPPPSCFSFSPGILGAC